MGNELTVFVIMTIIFIGGGLLNIFHYKPKEIISDRKKTVHGLISLTLGAWATVTLLIMGGFI